MSAVSHLTPITRVTIVDDQALLREGLAALFAAQPDIEVVSQHSSVTETMTHLAASRPDLLLLDVVMPGLSIYPLIEHVKAHHQTTKILCLTGFPTVSQCQKAMDAGADGFISKGVASSLLYTLIRRVLNGHRVVYPASSMLQDDDRFDTGSDVSFVPSKGDLEGASRFHLLTKREMEVVRLISRGYTAKAIGKELFISKRTVDRHKTNIMSKLQVKNQLALALCFNQSSANFDHYSLPG
jgi:DNA-binding NarL/FixJ family response regulator